MAQLMPDEQCVLCGSVAAWCVCGEYLCDACGRGFMRGDVIVTGLDQKVLVHMREDMRLLLKSEEEAEKLQGSKADGEES